jgi:6,7-dimethyl-8-ribityllumazine synthase
MLRKNNKSEKTTIGERFAIVASNYNAGYVDSMLRAAKKTLVEAKAQQIDVFRVPGAYEIPVVVARLLKGKNKYSAILCLGVVIRGETAHAQLIGEAVTNSLAQLQITHAVPIVHEVLLLENEDQAKVRCLDEDHNRGTEAAQTAMQMAVLMAQL